MFFEESGHLLLAHPNLKDLIEKLDGYLSTFDTGAIAHPSDYTTLLKTDFNKVQSLFHLYETVGVVSSVSLVQCATCHTYASANELKIVRVSGDELPCAQCGNNLATQDNRQVIAFRLTEHALHETRKNKVVPKADVSHLVLLLHGIRTDGAWQEKVAAELNLIPGVEAQPIGCGVLSTFQFWCPILTRSRALNKVREKIRLAKNVHEGAKVSVIAHSFGTYALFKLLNDTAEFRFFRVILCGSIVSDEYPWDHVQPRVKEKIVNDCGTRDIWPVAAKSLSWGYGATGTFGFKTVALHDRFHDIDHGGFFDSDFVKRFWVPYIETGEIVPSEWNIKRPSSPWYVNRLASLPLQWIATFVLVFFFRGRILSVIRQVARYFS